jgi:Chaperone of endosialidase
MAYNWPAENLTVQEKVGVGTETPTEKMEIKGNLKLNTGVAIGEFSSDTTFTTPTHQAVPTTQAVKTYVNAQVAAVTTALATKAEKGGSLTQNFQVNNLMIQGDLDVTGQTTFRNIEQHQGDLELGNEDTDQIRIHGVVRSTHSSGLVQITSPVNVLGNMTATKFIGDGSGLTGLPNQWSSDGTNLSYLGGNVGIGTTTPHTQLTLTGSLGFANATTPMMYIFQSGTANPDRSIISHSPDYPNWGLMYRDPEDKLIFQSSGTPVMTLALGAQTVGIGTDNPSDKLDVAGTARVLTGSNPLRFTAAWTGFPDAVTNQAEISNDTGTYKTLMIVGNRSAGLGRRVSIWDRLEVNGTTQTQRLQLGAKWLLSGVGDAHGNDDWLRLFNAAGSNYYGGLAAGRLWSSNGTVQSSDRRLKRGIAALPHALAKLLQLRGVSYYWNDENKGTTRQLGLIAQEVEEVFPELVEVGADGMSALNYTGLIPVLVESLKEQYQLIMQLKDEINTLKLRDRVGSP